MQDIIDPFFAKVWIFLGKLWIFHCAGNGIYFKDRPASHDLISFPNLNFIPSLDKSGPICKLPFCRQPKFPAYRSSKYHQISMARGRWTFFHQVTPPPDFQSNRCVNHSDPSFVVVPTLMRVVFMHSCMDECTTAPVHPSKQVLKKHFWRCIYLFCHIFVPLFNLQ